VISEAIVLRILNAAYLLFPSEIFLVASPNILSNSVARYPGVTLQTSLEIYFPDFVCYYNLRKCCNVKIFGNDSNNILFMNKLRDYIGVMLATILS
jgi:hypothetical protein